MSKKIQRPISILTSITTVAWMSGVVMLAPMAVGAAVVDGDIVSPDAEFTEDGVTYYPYDVFIVKIVGSKTFKRLILNPEVFESYGHLEWGNIQTISADTVAGYTTSNLVREINDTKVYKLTPDGDTGTKGWLNMTAAEFESEGYDWDSIYIINATDRDNYTTGAEITVGGGTTSEGTLTVSLAADTPAAGTAVSNAARVAFTKINLTATGGDVIVDSMTIERGGQGSDGAFSSVAVILDSEDGDQLGNNKTLNASHQTTLNDDLTVESGTTKSIYLAGNMGTLTSYAGQTPTLKLVAMTLKGDATLNATLPIEGNYKSLVSTVTIGTATVVAGGNAPSASTQNVGVTDYTVSAIKITGSSAEKITVKKIVWTQDGSADVSDVENVDLVNANTGEVIETIAKPTSKTLTFEPNITINKGKNVSFDLRLDIIDGSGRKISYDIDEQTDILIKGETYGYYITPTYTGVSSRPYYNAADTTIGDGSLRIESVSVSPTSIAEDKSDVILGKFKFVDKGEEVKITSIGWHVKIKYNTAGTTTSDLTNLTVYDENGTAVAGPMDLTYDNGDATYTYGTATTTDTIIVPIGETIYTVKGDLSADFTANDTVQIQVMPSIVTARGMTTDNSITPTPADWVSSTALTVKAASLTVTVSSDPAAQTVVAGTQDFVVAKYIFDATDSGADIKVTQVKVPVTTVSTCYPDMVTGIELYDGDNKISVDTESTAYSTAGSTAGGSATTTLNLATDALVISAGTTKTVTVKADVGTGTTGGSFRVGINTNGVTATDDDGNAVEETCTTAAGQKMSLAAGGVLNLSALTDPASALVIAGTSGVDVAKFSLQAKYEDINLNYLGITLSAPDNGIDPTNEYDQVASLALYEDGVSTALGSTDITAANATITPSSLTIPAGTTKNYTLKATFAALNDASPAESGAGLKFQITSLDATGASAGSTTITKNGLDATFNQFNIFKSLPTVTKLAFSGADTITGNSVVSLYKFKITADSAGPIGLFKFTFGISTTTVNLCNDATDVTDTTGYYLYMSDSEGSLGTVLSRGGSTPKADMVGTLSGTGGNEVIIETYFDVNDDDTDGTAEEQLIINAGDTKYFTLRGTIKTGHSGTVDDESISTVMAGDAAFSHTALERADETDARGDDDFIWTDLNVDQYSTSTATNTAMYVGGYRVSGLDSTSSTPQTISD